MEEVSIVIPNFNGRKHLEDNLPSLIKALNPTASPHEILVVDDGSTDSSVSFLRERYPEVQIIALEKNQGYINACNRGFLEAKSRLVYLMNNDVEVTPEFLNPLVKHFRDKDIFAVDSGEVNYDSKGNEIDRVISVDFKWGIVWYKYHGVPSRNKAYPTLFAHGGHTLFDKEKFLQLGSLDLLFSPIYWDCWDISFRAWRCGFKILHEPNSKVHHYHKATFGNLYSENKINTIHWKHRFLFTWKNLFSPPLWFKHLFFLPAVIAFVILTRKTFIVRGLIQASGRLLQLLRSRKTVKAINYIVSDKDLFSKFSEDKLYLKNE